MSHKYKGNLANLRGFSSNLKISKEATPTMNNMTTKAFENVGKLLKYLREKDYLE